MREKADDQELFRAFLHSTTTIFILIAALIYGTRVLVFLILIDGTLELAKKISKKARGFIYYSSYSPLSYVTRQEEKSDRDIHAALSGLCGMLAVKTLLPQFLIPSVLTLAFADPLARIIGKRYGKKKILHTKKTFVGSGVFWLVAALILYLTGAPPLTAVSIGFIAALLEIFSWSKKRYVILLQDNFLIPVGIAIGIFLTTLF
ncbi:MAG: hypothetical protein HY001_05340 [Candidatus Portnoybacteria bacterium]|nr:hypothetical protein [Candidatus Portnoybacteria bacterium]